MTARRTMTKAEVAAAFGVSVRAVTGWLAEGCPSTRGSDGRRRFDRDEVAGWREARMRPPAVASETSDPGELASRSTLARAELARRLTVARKNELELAAEKGLKDLGLEDRIRAAQTHDDLLEYTKKVIELVGSGAMTPERGRTLQGLLAQAGRHMKARSEVEGDDDPERLILTTEQGGRLVAAFEGIVSDARRAELLALVEAAAATDLKENPNVDLAARVEPDDTATDSEEEAP